MALGVPTVDLVTVGTRRQNFDRECQNDSLPAGESRRRFGSTHNATPRVATPVVCAFVQRTLRK